MSNISALITVMSAISSKMSRSFTRDFDELQLLQSSKKPLDSFVANTIKKVEQIAITELQEVRPKFGVLSKNLNQEGEDDSRWIISILDGQNNFQHSIPLFTFSIAVESRNIRGEKEVTAGMISVPALNVIYYAETGQGSWQEINGQHTHRIRVSSRKSKDAMLFTNHNIADPSTTHIRQIGCDSLSLAYLASGKADSCILKNSHYADIAAGLVLIREAGGVINELSVNKKHIVTELNASNL